MLACGRDALLAQTASFKKIPEDIQMNHEIDAGKYRKNHSKYRQPLFWGPVLEPFA